MVLDHGSWLVGRARELTAVREFLARVGADGAVRVLYGETGVGRTALLDAAAAMARGAGMQVLRVAGHQFEHPISRSSLYELLRPLTPDLERLSPLHRKALTVALGLGPGPAPPSRLVLGDAALALVRAAAERRPLLLVVDDLPWIDRSSAAVLGAVARQLTGTRVGLLAASRPGENGLFGGGELPGQDVEPLTAAASRDLVDRRHPRLAPRLRARLLREANGNPLGLLELAGSPGDARPADVPDVLPLGPRLQAVFAGRVADLPAATRELLLLAALDREADLPLLQGAAMSEDLSELAPAERARLVQIRASSRRLSFGHPLMQSAVVESSTADERLRAHRRLADLLPERRAWHLAAATREPDEQVAALLDGVARTVLRRGDAAGAVAALIRAADLSPGRAERARRLAEAAYLGVDITGELGNASRFLEDARWVDPQLGGSLRAAAAAAWMSVNGEGDIDSAHRLLVATIEDGRHGFDAGDHALIEALHTLLLVCWWAGREECWQPFFDFVHRLRPQAPDQLAILSRTFPDTARATGTDRAALVAAIERLDPGSDPGRIIRTNTSAVYLDLLGQGRAGAWRLVEEGRAGGEFRNCLGALMHLCLDDFVTGRWQEGKELADEGLALCRAHRYDFIAWYFLYHQALFAAGHGDDATARERADEVTRITTARNARGAARLAHHARALAAVGRADFEAAFRHAGELSPAGVLAPYTPHALWVAFDLVESAWRTGRRAAAAAHVRAMREADLPTLSPRLALLTAGAAAIVAEDDEHADDMALFASAETTPGADRWPFDLARIQLLHAERLRRRAPGQAHALLASAIAAFDRIGAVPWAERARAELRSTGAAGGGAARRHGLGGSARADRHESRS